MRYLYLLLMGLFSVSVWANNPMALRHLGSDQAPVHLYLFTGFSCPHCAAFHRNILPDIESKYIKKNKVYLTQVEMPVDKASLMASALVRCQGEQKGRALEKRFYQNQKKWSESKEPQTDLWLFAKAEDISKEEFDRCLNDGRLMDEILKQRTNLTSLYQVEKMPTCIIRHGESVIKIEGNDKSDIFKAIDDLLTQSK